MEQVTALAQLLKPVDGVLSTSDCPIGVELEHYQVFIHPFDHHLIDGLPGKDLELVIVIVIIKLHPTLLAEIGVLVEAFIKVNHLNLVCKKSDGARQ